MGLFEPFSPRELMSHSRLKPTLICPMTAHACAKIRCIPQEGGHSQMDGLVFAAPCMFSQWLFGRWRFYRDHGAVAYDPPR